jgi:hypothetical protein
LLISF